MSSFKKIFISHCSKDGEIMRAVSSSREELEKNFEFFCTNDKGIEAGKSRGDELRRELKNSDYLIAIITDSYLRSPICIAEISAFWAEDKKIIPIIYNGDIGRNFLQTLTGKDDIYLDGSDCSEENKQKVAEQFKRVLGIADSQAESIKGWIGKKQNDPDREDLKPFIGSTDVHENILHYCMQSGITKIQNSGVSSEILEKNLSDKKEVYLIGTTEKSIIAYNIEVFASLLSKGIDIYILVANAGHEFLRDVAAIEATPNAIENNLKWEQTAQSKFNRLNAEVVETNQDNLKTIYNKAKEMAEGDSLGHLYYGNAFNTIRQTIVLGANEEENLLWAYVTMTLPPQRAVDSLSLEVTANVKKGTSFVNALLKHVYNVKELAKRRNSIFEITEDVDLIEEFPENF